MIGCYTTGFVFNDGVKSHIGWLIVAIIWVCLHIVAAVLTIALRPRQVYVRLM